MVASELGAASAAPAPVPAPVEGVVDSGAGVDGAAGVSVLEAAGVSGAVGVSVLGVAGVSGAAGVSVLGTVGVSMLGVSVPVLGAAGVSLFGISVPVLGIAGALLGMDSVAAPAPAPAPTLGETDSEELGLTALGAVVTGGHGGLGAAVSPATTPLSMVELELPLLMSLLVDVEFGDIWSAPTNGSRQIKRARIPVTISVFLRILSPPRAIGFLVPGGGGR